jgi:L-ascorbate metabolism protein UlaG (beta-lactamase superfamily)
MGTPLALTWWGHSSATVEVGGLRVALDPLLTDRLAHLRRYAASPPVPEATRADVVMVSHLHADHLHLPSLRLFPRSATLIVPPGAERLVGRLGFDRVVVAEPGTRLVVEAGDRTATSRAQDCHFAGRLEVEVLAASHDGRRLPLPGQSGEAVGFRMSAAGRSVWYPGDTGLRDDMSDVPPVDLAMVPVGGWGPTLGRDHMDPGQAARAVARVGASWAVPVHWGTFWPTGLARVDRRRHRHLFVTPGERFAAAVEDVPGTRPVVVVPGERVELGG